MKLLSESVRIDSAFAPTNLIAATQTGAYVPMANYRRVLAVVTTAAVANGKNVTLQLYQAKDSAGTGAKALSDVVTKTSTGGAITATVENAADDLDVVNGYGYVTAQVTCNDTVAVQGTAILIRGNSRYGTDQA